MKTAVESLLWAAALFLGTSAIVVAGQKITPGLLRDGADPKGVLAQQINRAFQDSLSGASEKERKAALAEAEQYLRQTLDVADSAVHRRQLATVLELQGRPGDALVEYARAHLFDADELLPAQQQQAGAKALALLRESARYPTDPKGVATATFDAALYAGQIETARQALDNAATLLPQDEILWMQAQIEEKSGNLARAGELWRETLRFNSAHLGAAEKISLAAATPEEHEEAVAIVQRVLEAQGQHPRFWYYLGMHFKALGDVPKALEAMEQAYARGAWSSLYANALADLLEEDGQRLRAQKIRRQARELHPD